MYPLYGMPMTQQVPMTQPMLPAQQVTQVNGKPTNIRMAPNSSLIALDTTAPLAWLCVSDGIGNVTLTAYDIAPHQDAPEKDTAGILDQLVKRVEALEAKYESNSSSS